MGALPPISKPLSLVPVAHILLSIPTHNGFSELGFSEAIPSLLRIQLALRDTVRIPNISPPMGRRNGEHLSELFSCGLESQGALVFGARVQMVLVIAEDPSKGQGLKQLRTCKIACFLRGWGPGSPRLELHVCHGRWAQVLERKEIDEGRMAETWEET